MKLPELFVERMSKYHNIDINDFLSSYDLPVESGIRFNPCKFIDKASIIKEFGDIEKVPWCSEGYYISKDDINGNHPYHLAGLFYFQEPSAMCAAELLPLNSGDYVLDLCAAPGGKSTQIAANRDITLVANEIITKRSFVLSENIERMGFSNTIVTNESPERLEQKFEAFFDKIIIDAPCSGEGMFKKEPAAIEAWSVEHVESCAARQRKIIDSAMKMLKPGGGIVYSTCTFSVEENEQNVSYILKEYPYMQKVKVTKIYPHLQRGEGHFAAYLVDTRNSSFSPAQKDNKATCSKEAIDLYRKFEKENLNVSLNGEFVLFGDNLYLKPSGVPIDGIKTVRPGLHLGECKKGRFEPGHALAKALSPNSFKSVAQYNLSDGAVVSYLKGETLVSDKSGYTAVVCDGLVLGWAKGSSGVLKNKLPKGLRIF